MAYWKMLLMLAVMAIFAGGCQTSASAPAEKAPVIPLDVRWVRQSVEYQALCSGLPPGLAVGQAAGRRPGSRLGGGAGCR